jgi:hypothetical protein
MGRQGIDLGESPQNHHVWPLHRKRDLGPVARIGDEVVIGLVDHHQDRIRHRVDELLDLVGRFYRPCGVVGVADDHHAGGRVDGRPQCVEIETERVIESDLDVSRAGPDSREPVHDEARPPIDDVGPGPSESTGDLGEEGDTPRAEHEIGEIDAQLLGQGMAQIPTSVVGVSIRPGQDRGGRFDHPGEWSLGAFVGGQFDDVGWVEAVGTCHILELAANLIGTKGGDF